MTERSKGNSGGFHFRDIDGGVKMTVHGDMVAGDKITNETTTIRAGFSREDQKQQFALIIEDLMQGLREIKTRIDGQAALGQDQKEEALVEVLQQLKSLKEIREKSAAVTAGKPAPGSISTDVDQALKQTERVVAKLGDMASKAAGIGQTVGEFMAKYGPLIAKARHLFGLT